MWVYNILNYFHLCLPCPQLCCTLYKYHVYRHFATPNRTSFKCIYWNIWLQSFRTYKERPKRPLTFETFDQSDEETWPYQHLDNFCHFWFFSSKFFGLGTTLRKKSSTLLKIVKRCQNCWKLSKLLKLSKKCPKLSKNCQNVGQVMFLHHSDQTSQRSQVSRVTL